MPYTKHIRITRTPLVQTLTRGYNLRTLRIGLSDNKIEMKKILAWLGITFGLVVCGILSSFVLWIALPQGTLTFWESWGTPPGGAVKIARLEAPMPGRAQVVVLNPDGQAFTCCAHGIGNWTPAEASYPIVNDDCALQNYKPDEPAFRNFQGQIADCAAGHAQGGWQVDADLYVVKQDGSVAFAHYAAGFSALYNLLFPLTCGFILLGWIVFGIVMWRRGDAAVSR